MKNFNILKRNRKYYAALLEGNHKCKILIDTASENLELGEQSLEVDDISVRSKYGTDLIFKLSASVDEQQNAGICTLRTPGYNSILVDKCHELGGKWDADEKCWIFSGLVSDRVEILDEMYNSQLIGVEITFLAMLYADQTALEIEGFPLARAFGRDSGAKLESGIAVIEGGFSSGGSRKNWDTRVGEGTIIRMEIPELVLQTMCSDKYTIKKI